MKKKIKHTIEEIKDFNLNNVLENMEDKAYSSYNWLKIQILPIVSDNHEEVIEEKLKYNIRKSIDIVDQKPVTAVIGITSSVMEAAYDFLTYEDQYS